MHSIASFRPQRLNAEERSRLVSVFRASGLTQAEFAQEQGIKVSTLRQWLYRSASKIEKKLRFQEMPVASLLSPSWVAEVTLDSGLALRLSSSARADWICSVVSALRRSQC